MQWSASIIINNIPYFTDSGLDAQQHRPGRYGSQYARMVKVGESNWIVVYTIYDNSGYTFDPAGGSKLQIAHSADNCRTWTVLATIDDPGRDLDNGQLTQLPNGVLLLAARSVRWQESYRLPVYRSPDLGRNWSLLSAIDANEDAPGSPDKGIYEPHCLLLDSGTLAVMYANEKHVVETPSFSQIISQRLSTDQGATWGEEIRVAAELGGGDLRPGMPVWAKMQNGKYIVVYEVVDWPEADVHYKISADGIHWSQGVGSRIRYQWGGPFILSLPSGDLLVTSNSGAISASIDLGETWQRINPPPWPYGTSLLWSSLYQIDNNEIAFLSSVPRLDGGHNVQIRFANWPPES